MKTLMLKISSLVMALSIVVGLAASCGGGGGGGGGETDAELPSGSGVAVTEESARLYTKLPERDLGGFKMTVFQRGRGNEAAPSGFFEPGFYTAEQNGETVNDAIYIRNQSLEEKYNFTIDEITRDDVTEASNHAITVMLAGDDTYDVLIFGPNYFANYANRGLVIDLYSLDNFDFSQPWWYQVMNEGMTIDNKLYMTVGAHMLHAKNGLYMILFNEKIARDYNISPDGLYQSVRDSQWTADKLIETVSLVKKDLNGDGVYDHNDLCGFGTENYGSFTLPLGSGFRIAEKDENDIPGLSFYSEKNAGIIEKYMKLFGDTQTTLVTQTMTGVADVWAATEAMWKNDQFFMRMNALGSGNRTMESDYGILPIPKFTEDQEHYYHTASIWNSPVMGIPKSCSDLDKTSYIIEMMACESLYGLVPEFYDNYLTTKLVRNRDSIEMLQIIHESIYFDVGSVFNWGSLLNILYRLTSTRQNNMASEYAAAEPKALEAMNATLKAIMGE